jgi:hypothetical protein
MMGRVGFEHGKGLANFARLCSIKQILKAALAVGFAKAFPEEAVGKGHVIILRQQHQISRQLV